MIGLLVSFLPVKGQVISDSMVILPLSSALRPPNQPSSLKPGLFIKLIKYFISVLARTDAYILYKVLNCTENSDIVQKYLMKFKHIECNIH